MRYFRTFSRFNAPNGTFSGTLLQSSHTSDFLAEPGTQRQILNCRILLILLQLYHGCCLRARQTVHHFRAIDYVIDTAEETLSEEIIKQLHYILKHDIRDSTLSWFAVGDYNVLFF